MEATRNLERVPGELEPVASSSPAELSRGRQLRFENQIVRTKTELRTVQQAPVSLAIQA